MSKTPTSWPKPYLLAIYEKALEEGCCRVIVGDPKTAASLIQSFYRLRRRSDTQHQSFIKPEYHLITGTWEPELKAVLFTYSSLPDGATLPSIDSVPASERFAKSPSLQQQQIVTADSAEDVDIDALMASLLQDASRKINSDE